MRTKYKLWLFFFIPVYLAYHLYTLDLNPLPWFDEVYYASMAQNVVQEGEFVAGAVHDARDGQEDLSYGPLHLLLTGYSMQVFGAEIFVFRLAEFVFGLLCLCMTLLLFRLFNPDTWMSALLVMAMALDPFFQLSLHEGRMDLAATFFALSSIYFLLKAFRRPYFEVHLGQTMLSGVLAALAMLTTPRIFVLLLPLFGVFVQYLLTRGVVGKWKYFVGWLLPALLLYSGWVWYAYGGPAGWLAYYQGAVQGNETARHGFLWAPLHFFYVPRHVFLLIGVAVLLVIIGALQRGVRYFNYLVMTSLVILVTFYIVVVDYGPYSTLILPFYYLLIFQTLYWQGKQLRFWRVSSLAFYALLVFNLGYTGLKGLQVLGEQEARDPDKVQPFVDQHIGEGKKVVGDATYYYAVTKAGSRLQLIDKYDTHENRERKHRESWEYDYLIVSDMLLKRRPDLIDLYIKNGRLQEVARYRVAPDPLFTLPGNLRLLSNMEASGYSGRIYRRTNR